MAPRNKNAFPTTQLLIPPYHKFHIADSRFGLHVREVGAGARLAIQKLRPHGQNLPKFQAFNPRHRQILFCAFLALCHFLSENNHFSNEKCHFYYFDI